jgi:hypothetical protein
MGNKEGMQALIILSEPEDTWAHYMIHRESAAVMKLSPKMSEVMDTVIRTINYIKTHQMARGSIVG